MLVLAGAVSAAAQELEPRAYSPSPVGTTFLLVGIGRSAGDISFDSTIPIDGNAILYFPTLAIGRTFGLFGRQALITAAQPYVWGSASGDVGEQQHSITRSGLADVGLRFSLNLHGSPAMTPKQFAKVPHRNVIVAASLAVTAPSGQYDKARLINLGTNRWSFKPEIGLSYPVRKFYIDFYAAGRFFTQNENFFPGQFTRSQAPFMVFQGHASYAVRPGLWLALDSTWYGGGATSINGGPPASRQANSRLGTTLSLPLTNGQSLKITYSSGLTGRIGGKFQTVNITWQAVFFDRS